MSDGIAVSASGLGELHIFANSIQGYKAGSVAKASIPVPLCSLIVNVLLRTAGCGTKRCDFHSCQASICWCGPQGGQRQFEGFAHHCLNCSWSDSCTDEGTPSLMLAALPVVGMTAWLAVYSPARLV